jgi:hypothetical protein
MGFPWQNGDPLLAADLNEAIANAGGGGGGGESASTPATINVLTFGAKGDGTTDDTDAINAAFDRVRELQTVTDHAMWHVTFPAGRYVVTGPINMTGLIGQGSGVIDGCGSEIWLKGATAVLDLLTSRWLIIKDLQVYGDPVLTPKIGIQIGRIHSQSADFITMSHVNMWGSYTLTAFYNFASETFTAYACTFDNMAAAATSWCAIMDGINHFNASSTFVSVIAPVDSTQSNNSSVFDCCTFQVAGGGGNVWMSFCSGHSYRHCYASNFTGSPFVIYQPPGIGGPAVGMLEIDCHCETSGLTHMVMFSGPPGVTFAYAIGLALTDYDMQAQVSVLHIDPASAVTGVELREARFRLGGPCPALVDNPAKWAIQCIGAALPQGMWNNPSGWSGPVYVLGDARLSFTVAQGWPSSARPTARPGAFGYATDTNTFEWLDATGWHSWVSTLGGSISGGLAVGNTASLNGGVVIRNGNNVDGSMLVDGNWGILMRGYPGSSSDIGLQASDGSILVRVRSGGRVELSGNIGFNGANAIAKPAVTGSRAGNAALASLLTALASYGLITDSSTA